MAPTRLESRKEWVLGVLADTHVPDRVRRLNPAILAIFQEAGVQAILHAGDICTPRVLAQLSHVAPAYAVRGNRDWFFGSGLPDFRQMQFGEVTVAMAHGHGSLRRYARDKVRVMIKGMQPERYEKRMLDAFPEADIIVFGHTHMRVNRQVDGRLLFNPGSASCRTQDDLPPSVGLIRIFGRGQVEAEFVEITSP